MEQIVRGLSNFDYHYGEATREYISSSILKLYATSPLVARYAMDHRDEGKQTDAQRFGSLFHSLMEAAARAKERSLTLTEWGEAVAVFNAPINPKTEQPYGSSTKAFIEAYAAFAAANQGKMIASRDEVVKVMDMAYPLLDETTATGRQTRKLLRYAKEVETSFFWESPEGAKLKIRPDLLTSNKLIDWKTIRLDSLDEDTIARQIVSYGYHISMSMYQFVLHEILGKWYAPILVFVTKDEPYDAVMCDISEWCFSFDPVTGLIGEGIGAQEFQLLLNLHTKCLKENSWPGAEHSIPDDGGIKIMRPKVPIWLQRKYYEDET